MLRASSFPVTARMALGTTLLHIPRPVSCGILQSVPGLRCRSSQENFRSAPSSGMWRCERSGPRLTSSASVPGPGTETRSWDWVEFEPKPLPDTAASAFLSCGAVTSIRVSGTKSQIQGQFLWLFPRSFNPFTPKFKKCILPTFSKKLVQVM